MLLGMTENNSTFTEEDKELLRSRNYDLESMFQILLNAAFFPQKVSYLCLLKVEDEDGTSSIAAMSAEPDGGANIFHSALVDFVGQLESEEDSE